MSHALFLALIGVHQITSYANLKTVIFKQYAAESAGTRFISLFPGLGYAAGYKVRGRSRRCGKIVSGIDRAPRFFNGYTNTVGNHSYGIILRYTMATSSIERLGKGRGRP